MLRVISFFAGIEGFGLGCEQAGMKVVAHVEKDANCRKLLKAKFPDADTLEDVAEATADNLPQADILCAGWPCQDLSVAGKRAGLIGERSGLFYHVPRIADELGITFVVWENVVGLLSSDEGRDMLRVIAEFQRFGYHGAWRTFDAQYFGLAQRHRRVFGVFARSDIGIERCIQILSIREGMRGHPAPRREARKSVAGTIGGSSQSGGFRATDLDNNGAFIPEVARAVNAERDGYNDGSDQTYISEVSGALDAKHNVDRADWNHFSKLVAGTVTAKWAKGSGEPAGNECQNLVPTAYRTTGNNGCREQGKITACLNTATDLSQNIVAFQPRVARNGRGGPSDIVPALSGATSGETSDMRPCVQSANAVRRLTPLEYERLQGFPDGWTKGFSDSVRYRMLGNAVPPPITRWIAQRIIQCGASN